MATIIQPLSAIAERTNAPFGLVHHTTKLRGEDITANSSRGSNAIFAAMRAMIGFDRFDAKSKWCRFRMLKENLGIAPPAMGMRVTDTGLEFGSPPERPEQEDKEPNNTELAEEFLLSRLQPGVTVASGPLIEEGKANGLSRTTLFRAQRRLKVRAAKVGTAWNWTLPETRMEC
jgi:hypothetical protein